MLRNRGHAGVSAVDPNPALDRVVAALAAAPAVRAVTLIGSSVTDQAGPESDLDIVVYADDDLAGTRSALAEQFADRERWVSVGETAFGNGDVWSLKDDGRWLDILYWSPSWAEEHLRTVAIEHRASMGYTTAFWRSIRDGQPLFERDEWHRALQREARRQYPDQLRRNIVALNFPYLRDHVFSFRNQLRRAISRRDLPGVNHRVAAWLASYVDVVFAVNAVLHPGEKRIVEIMERECRRIPDGAADDIARLVSASGGTNDEPITIVDAMVASLRNLLREEGLLPPPAVDSPRGNL